MNSLWVIAYKEDAPYSIEGMYPPDYQGVYPDKNFVKVSQEVRDALWEKMQQHRMCYDRTTNTFVPYIPKFDELKNVKLSELETSFDTCVSGAFTCSQGWPMQFDRSDTLAVEGAIQLLKSQNEHTGYLTDANDKTHYGVPLETMEAVKLEMLQAYARCHAHKQELRKIINNAQTKEELAEITISWPGAERLKEILYDMDGTLNQCELAARDEAKNSIEGSK